MADRLGIVQAALTGRYRIERELGHGETATVYLAQDLKHHRPVAVKVLHSEVAAALGADRFLREIEVAARLQHPHILPLHDSDVADGLLYYVMPYVESESLRERLGREKQLPIEDALRIAREVASALDYAHRHGVIHRDIKPENILLSGGEAVVADFGIARAVREAGDEKLTGTGILVGTPGYMSPEQAMAGAIPDGRSDIYCLGCVLFEMLGGQPPFTGPTAEIVLYQHINATPPDIRGLRPSLPGEIHRALARSLAKLPADRFATAGEFAEALTLAPTPVPPSSPTPHVAPRRHRVLLTAAVVALAAVAIVAWRNPELVAALLRLPGSAQPHMKNWILVAEFDGPADDPDLAVATRELVSAALDESRVVATVPRDQIASALAQAGKPATARVDAELARELAYRSSVRAVLEGRITRIGKGYALVLRVTDVDSSRVVASLSDAADREANLVGTVGRIARRLRERLGERPGAIQATRPLVDAMTPSLEAYRRVMRGRERSLNWDDRGAIDLYRSALALDPNFATAWGAIGVAFFNLQEPDSALASFLEALRHPERLSDSRRLLAQAAVAELEGNLSAALAAYDRLLRLDPAFAVAYTNRGSLLTKLGRFEEALADCDQVIRLSPFGPTQPDLFDRWYNLLALGRHDEAREAARRLQGPPGKQALIWIAEASADWRAVDSLGTTLASDPATPADVRRTAVYAMVGAEAARGAVGAAIQLLQRDRTQDKALDPEESSRTHLMLAILSGRTVADLEKEMGRDTSTAAVISRGLWSAAAGKTSQARTLLDRTRSRPGTELRRYGACPTLLEAWIAASAGQWERVVQLLGPTARQGMEVGIVPFFAGKVPIEWLMADAHEHLGAPDSAAVDLERLLSPLGNPGQVLLYRGVAFSFAHRRLVLLYSRLGRLAEARKHWKIFAETFTRPDPELVPMIEQARVALASAEAMAASSRH